MFIVVNALIPTENASRISVYSNPTVYLAHVLLSILPKASSPCCFATLLNILYLRLDSPDISV